MRAKTEIELAETPQEQVDRLRGALFAAHQASSFKKAKDIMWKAMGGELHGHEPIIIPHYTTAEIRKMIDDPNLFKR